MGYASCTEATKLMKAFLIVLAALISIAAWKKDSGLAEHADEPGRYERLEHTVQPRHASLDVAKC